MSASAWTITGSLLALYLLFLVWYGGRGRPLGDAEREALLGALQARVHDDQSRVALDQIRRLVAHDDGREFLMQNLVRHREHARYPAGSAFGGDARDADRRYGRAIVWPLLRHGSLPVFVAPRIGHFIEPQGLPQWHYAALVRYRSRRDFLRFALAIETEAIVMHKWAAIDITQVFPVRPLVSLIAVRSLVAAALLTLGLLVHALLRWIAAS